MGGREIEYALIMPKEVRVKFAPTLYFLLKVALPWYEDITIVVSELSMATAMIISVAPAELEKSVICFKGVETLVLL